MLSKYLSNPDYNFEKVNRASVACGPLVKWAIAQVSENSLESFKSCHKPSCYLVEHYVQYHRVVILRSFHLNGLTLGFNRQSQN